MKFLAVCTCITMVLLGLVAAQWHENAQAIDEEMADHWSSDSENELDEADNHSRSKRAVDLRTLRQLMNNIAFSEYYRLKGLEVLGNLGMGHGRPFGIPANTPAATQTNSLTTLSVPSAALLQALASSQVASVAAPPSSSSAYSSGGGGKKGGLFSFPLRSDEFSRFFGTLERSIKARRG